MLTWLDEDLTLLKGQECCALVAFDHFVYAPAKTNSVATSASVCEGLVEMASRNLSSLMVETSADNAGRRVLSATTFRDLFPVSFSVVCENAEETGPLLRAMTGNASIMPPACFILP
ncbi:hypothetical protein GN244_ATG03061 [Phytophthora infestans]|uniref:Uncharacterized protein n=1 Tax=Phytophthora infestans TaxID=4787 RepID=A0A833W6M5_PHYIN|nr:hypothetical protein GN244_ATG03061 [Phytophthora infestans]KAF4132975.1 hypothetical protein GN958_ATG17884 [Phytophthora infestans]